jgi:WD40 repeat protein
MPLRPTVLLAACLALLPGQVARSQSPVAQEVKAPPAKRAARIDRYGDPLPPGALARIGTVRFRQFFGLMRFSPDGKVLTSVSDGKVYLWEVATGRELRQFKLPRENVERLALSPDGTVLAAVARAPDAPGEATMSLWEVSTGKEFRRIRGEQPRVSTVVFSPDGQMLASGDARGGNAVYIWDVRAGKQSRLLLKEPKGANLSGVLFSPDGKTLAAPIARKIYLWDAATGGLVRTLEGHQGAGITLAFSPDGRHLFSSSLDDHTIRRWDVATGKGVSRFGPEPRYWGSFVLAPDGKTLAVFVVRPSNKWGDEAKIYVLETATGKPLVHLG